MELIRRLIDSRRASEDEKDKDWILKFISKTVTFVHIIRLKFGYSATIT